jgi:uncharacterized protein (TIGR02001 family)
MKPHPAKNNIEKLQSSRESRHSRVAALMIAAVISLPCALPCHGAGAVPVSSADRALVKGAATDGSSADGASAGVDIDSNDLPQWKASAYVTWTTDYVYRGISLTGNDPTWQGGADIAHRSGIFAGLWTSALDFAPPIGPNTEHNAFVGYSHDFGMAWNASVRYTRFDFRSVYTGEGSPFRDNAFNQWQVDVRYNRATTLRVYQTDNTYGMRFFSTTVELQHVVPIADNWLLSGLFGRWDDLETLGIDHYNYLEFAGSWSVPRVNVTVQYHHADSRGRKAYGKDPAQPGWLASVTYRLF